MHNECTVAKSLSLTLVRRPKGETFCAAPAVARTSRTGRSAGVIDAP